MPTIVISISNMGAQDSGDGIRYGGTARVQGMEATDDPVYWTADVAVDALPATVNADIRDAAVNAAALVGWTIGTGDQKLLLGGGAAV